MNILIDIGHPAHVHLFRHFIKEIGTKGHRIIVVAKKVDSIINLLYLYSIPYYSIGQKSDSILLKYLNQIKFVAKTAVIAKKEKIDIGIGVSMTLPIVSKLTGLPSFGLDDDDMKETPVASKFLNRSTYILTPDCLGFENRGKHHITYPAYHELAYLHPDRFNPDPEVLKDAGVEPNERYFVLRFNAFKAHHDTSASGLTTEQKKELIKFLEPQGKVFITTEKEIDEEFRIYQLKVSPDKIHSLLYYATMFIGDSQTMTSEAAVLGTPAFKCNTFAGKLSIPNELEKRYRLCFSYEPQHFSKMLSDIELHLKNPQLKQEFQDRQKSMLKDKIDLTSFLVELVGAYPASVERYK